MNSICCMSCYRRYAAEFHETRCRFCGEELSPAQYYEKLLEIWLQIRESFHKILLFSLLAAACFVISIPVIFFFAREWALVGIPVSVLGLIGCGYYCFASWRSTGSVYKKLQSLPQDDR